MTPKLRIASITDEFTADLGPALDAMAGIGMTGAELRVLWGKNIMDLSTEELRRAKQLVADHGMEVISIASPILKCVLPNAADIDARFQHDVFASKHSFDDQPGLADHAFDIAEMMGAKIIRVFSYWRTVEPRQTYPAVIDALNWLSEKAAARGLIIGLENEHACNISTAGDAAEILAAVAHRNLQLVWDPANALCSGENPFPEGYAKLPKDRIVHVHAKDCHMDGHKPIWGPLGTRAVDWKGQIAALLADGYQGWLSLETHWPGPNNSKMEASTICGWNLRGLASA